MKALCLAVLITSLPAADYTTKKIEAKKKDLYETTSRYLEFSTTHPLASIINPELKLMAANEQKRWVAEVVEMQKEYKMNTPWTQEFGMEAAYVTPKLASITIMREGYTGGAHGYGFTDTRNFGLVNGKPKKLTLEDFFDPTFKPGPYVSKLIVAKLKKEEGADWVHNGEFKKVEPKQLQRFSASPNGLTWYFNAYEVGPYAAGDFEVKLSVAELGAKFKKGMLK